MLRKSDIGAGALASILLFALRNLVLISLLVNAFFHFKEELNLAFVIVSYILAVVSAVLLERTKLRLLPAFIIVGVSAVALRFLFFGFFKLFIPLDRGIDADFLYFYFDKDFFPSLVPCAIAWVFNFLALRYRWFIYPEAGANSLLLALVFATEANFNITIYHPTFFGIYLTLFILAEVAVLILGWSMKKKEEAGIDTREHPKKKRFLLSYLWVIIPLVLLLVFYLVLMNLYNNASSKSRGGLMESTLLRFDFSKYIKLESEIKLSDDLVMIFRKNGYAQRLLLRRFVLSKYDTAGGFYQSTAPGTDDIPVTVPDTGTSLPDPGFRDREDVTQDYFFVNLDPTSLIAMNYPVKIVPLKNWDESSFLRIYRVVSRVSQYQLYEEYINVKPPQMDAASLKFYTEYGNDKKIKELAEEVTTDETSYFGKVIAVQNYLRDNYLYSLKPGLATETDDGNQLHRFLFTSKKGYCSYFAFGMALMLRSLGIPARVAVGFFANPDWQVMNFYEIRANQAHAWVEVNFGNLGWIEFDPTSQNLAPGEDISFMLNFELSDKLKQLISEILKNQDKLAEEEITRDSLNTDAFRFSNIIIVISSWLASYWYLVLPCLYLIFIAGMKLSNLIVFALAGNPRKKTKRIFNHAVTKLHGVGIMRQPGESLLEFAGRTTGEGMLASGEFVALTDIYLKAVFAESFTKADFPHAIAAYAGFIRAFGKRYNVLLRIGGFLNPLHVFKKA
jgi:transglutaminase-like putative cysteine protease